MANARHSSHGNKGQGGHTAQLEKVAQNIRPDLVKNGGSKKQNTVGHGVEFFPESAPENAMAPPQRQQRKSVRASI